MKKPSVLFKPLDVSIPECDDEISLKNKEIEELHFAIESYEIQLNKLSSVSNQKDAKIKSLREILEKNYIAEPNDDLLI